MKWDNIKDQCTEDGVEISVSLRSENNKGLFVLSNTQLIKSHFVWQCLLVGVPVNSVVNNNNDVLKLTITAGYRR